METTSCIQLSIILANCRCPVPALLHHRSSTTLSSEGTAIYSFYYSGILSPPLHYTSLRTTYPIHPVDEYIKHLADASQSVGTQTNSRSLSTEKPHTVQNVDQHAEHQMLVITIFRLLFLCAPRRFFAPRLLLANLRKNYVESPPTRPANTPLLVLLLLYIPPS